MLTLLIRAGTEIDKIDTISNLNDITNKNQSIECNLRDRSHYLISKEIRFETYQTLRGPKHLKLLFSQINKYSLNFFRNS